MLSNVYLRTDRMHTCMEVTGEPNTVAEVMMTQISLIGPETLNTIPEQLLIKNTAAN
jgi:hypothetical protein